ncbi:hypothetical protein MAR_001990, partial [Mya arenaria]
NANIKKYILCHEIYGSTLNILRPLRRIPVKGRKQNREKTYMVQKVYSSHLSYNCHTPNTISLIINEVCDAIKAKFAAQVMRCPTSTEQFEKRWQFPHCRGALDGKHMAGLFSIVLMALVNVNNNFLVSDGTINDASIYKGSELKEGLERSNNIFNLMNKKRSLYLVMTFLSHTS